jgi:hypothetical protein
MASNSSQAMITALRVWHPTAQPSDGFLFNVSVQTLKAKCQDSKPIHAKRNKLQTKDHSTPKRATPHKQQISLSARAHLLAVQTLV